MFKHGFVLATLLGAVACGSTSENSGESPNGEVVDAGAQGDTPGVVPPSTDDAGAPADPPVDAAPPVDPKSGAPYPIVFVHGMAGFEKLGAGPIKTPYWAGVVEDFEKRGETVYVTVTPPYDTSEVRAASLAEQIDAILEKTGKAKVNIVAHSQGGLDSRVLVSPAGLGYGSKVATVSTISTPHRGSRVADAVLGLVDGVPKSVVDDLTGTLLGLVQGTLYDIDSDPHIRAQVVQLSEQYMAKTFNPTYVDATDVAYFSYAGRSNLRSGNGACDGAEIANDPDDVDPTSPMLVPTVLFLEDGNSKKNVNDGLVTVESARWGKFVQCVPADHLKEVGVLGSSLLTFDHVAFIRSIVEHVRATGN